MAAIRIHCILLDHLLLSRKRLGYNAQNNESPIYLDMPFFVEWSTECNRYALQNRSNPLIISRTKYLTAKVLYSSSPFLQPPHNMENSQLYQNVILSPRGVKCLVLRGKQSGCVVVYCNCSAIFYCIVLYCRCSVSYISWCDATSAWRNQVVTHWTNQSIRLR